MTTDAQLRQCAARVRRAEDVLDTRREELRAELLRAYNSGASLRALGRVVGVSHVAILKQLDRA
jgi:transposase-like protein